MLKLSNEFFSKQEKLSQKKTFKNYKKLFSSKRLSLYFNNKIIKIYISKENKIDKKDLSLAQRRRLYK